MRSKFTKMPHLLGFLMLQIRSIKTEAAVRSYSVKVMFLKISQNSQEKQLCRSFRSPRKVINERR